MYMIVHLRVGVGWKLDVLGLFPYRNTLFTPAIDYNGRMTMLSMMGISLCTWSLWGWFFSASWTAFRADRIVAS